MIKNLMEDEVFMSIENIVKPMKELCKCEKCIDDIAAIALNDLKPNYVVTEKGYLYSKANNMDYQFNTDVTTAVIKAIEIVKNNPRHNE